MEQLINLQIAMMEWEKGEPKRMHHYIKVHSLAKMIGSCEHLDPKTRLILEISAMIHDVGIKPAKENDLKATIEECDAQSVISGREMLEKLGFASDIIDRVCHIIGVRHTIEDDDIDGMDLQILIEAEYLVNLYEQLANKETINNVYENIFKTKTGVKIFKRMYAKSLDEIV